MDDDKLLKLAASNKPESTPSLDQAVDNFVDNRLLTALKPRFYAGSNKLMPGKAKKYLF